MFKFKKYAKRFSAMFCAIICIMSVMSMAFASGIDGNTSIGWPTAGQDNSEDILSPTNDSVANTTGAVTDTQEAIQSGFGFTNPDISGTINTNTTADSQGDLLASNIYAQYSDTLPDVSINDLIHWSNAKGAEIIHFLQTFIEPFAVIIFMIGAIMVLVGSIGNSQISGKGFMGMVMSILCYAACLYAPSILSWMVAWLGTVPA